MLSYLKYAIPVLDTWESVAYDLSEFDNEAENLVYIEHFT